MIINNELQGIEVHFTACICVCIHVCVCLIHACVFRGGDVYVVCLVCLCGMYIVCVCVSVCMCTRMCGVFIGSCLATKVFLPAMGMEWVIINNK